MECPLCKKDIAELHKWTPEISNLTCLKCNRRWWWLHKEGRIMTESEIIKMGKDFNE